MLNDSRLRRVLTTCALGAVHFVVALTGIRLATAADSGSHLWYALGTALAVLLVGGARRRLSRTAASSDEIVSTATWRRIVAGARRRAVAARERARTEAALRDSEARLKLVFDSTSDVLLLFAVEGERRYQLAMANPAFRRRLAVHNPEWGSRDPVGLPVDALLLDALRLPPNMLQRTHDRFARAVRAPEPLTYESHDWGLDDETFDVTLVAVHDERGRCTHLLRSARDVTERMRAEQRRLRLEAELVQAQKMEAIGTLAGGIAHDFNNMLTAIVGNAELARAELPKESSVHEDLDQVVKAAARARDLVQQILTFSRKRDFQRQPVRPNEVVRDVMRLLRASLPATIELRTEDRSDDATILADPTQLHQVLMNLCTNAVHAMDGCSATRGGCGTIAIRQEVVAVSEAFARRHPGGGLKPGMCVRLSVSDTGRGMDARTVSRIFEPFFTTKPAGVGTGLGLSVVHGIVRKHDGGIEVESTPGAGTTFHVYLPLAEATASGGGAAGASAVESAPLGRGEHVLLVDDEAIVVMTARRLLERLGYVVSSFASATEALSAFAAAPDRYDIVVSDLTMPELTGTELSAAVRETRPDVPIVLATGYLEELDLVRASALGVTELLAKPFDTHTLALAMRRALGRAAA